MSEEAGPHLRAMADVLWDLSLDIENLGALLCADAELVARHTQALQAIDLIAQKQRALAALLRADCPRRALSDIGLDDLRTRLHELAATNAQGLLPN